MAAKKPGNPYKVRCKVCAKDISIGLHGITARFSHADSTKYKERLPKDTPISFFKHTKPSSSASTLLSNDVGDSSEASSSKQTTISICTNKQLVRKAEIIWALDVVMSKYLFNSSSNKSDLFTTMFPDSGIAKNFSCGKTKCGFIVKFGIAPYSVELMNSQLKDLKYFVALFDESFNCVAKKTKWTCIFDFGILTKTLWLQGAKVQNSLVSHLQMIYAPISNSVLVH